MSNPRNRKALSLPDRQSSRPAAAGPAPFPSPPVDPIVEKAALQAWNTHGEELVFYEVMRSVRDVALFPMGDRELPPGVADRWRWLARRLLELKIDPTTYVRRHWRRRPNLMKPLYADQLTNEGAIGKFASLTESVYREWFVELRIQTNKFPTAVYCEKGLRPEMDDGAAMALVLATGGGRHDLPAFFCMCVAAQISEKYGGLEKFDKISRELYEMAASDFLQDPDAYLTVWSPIIPIPQQFLAYFDAWYRDLREGNAEPPTRLR